MKFPMRLRCQTIVVLCYAVLAVADQDVNSANVIPSYKNEPVIGRTSRASQSFKPYAFRPRAVPLNTEKVTTQATEQKNVYYTKDNKYKTEILFPGNYFAIPKEKSTKVEEADYDPLVGGHFEPKAIPLLRDQGFAKRSLDTAEEPIKNKELVDQSSQRRSFSFILGEGEGEEDEEEEDGEYEAEEEEEPVEAEGVALENKGGHGGHLGHIGHLGHAAHAGHIAHKLKHKAKRAKKYSKYMMPLLLAYKLKYFAIIPVMIGGLVLLVGATGLAGFFFALFAAVMGLQKGGY